METRSNSYALYRAAKLKEGAAFQDFIMERSARIGMILNAYCSKEGQRLGENLMGMEIKRDGRYRETQNLYIEVAEKARPRSGDYAPSGIMRSDNSWLYGIGDELQFWIFAISLLRHFYSRRSEMKFRDAEIETSRGFLIPTNKATQFCARRIDFDFDGQIKNVLNGNQPCHVDLSSKDGDLSSEFQFHLKLA